MPLLARPGKIHDKFCRCRRCKPVAAQDAPHAPNVAIVCMLLITGATCLAVLH